jgi:hypothetical protein
MNIPKNTENRLKYLINLSWLIFQEKVNGKQIKTNKEASMQLHLGSIIKQLGNLFCFKSGEEFKIAMEEFYKGKNIDIICSIKDIKVAIELKCIKEKTAKGTYRGAHDLSRYHIYKDIERLESYKDDFELCKFLCMTDDSKIWNKDIKGYASSFNTGDGYLAKAKVYPPPWKGKWQNKASDKEITFKNSYKFQWIKGTKYRFLNLDIS